MIMHALQHRKHGFPLPTIWLGVRDTMRNHELTTFKTLRETFWEGRWRIHDKTARYTLDGEELIQLELIGADSPSDTEKVRTMCHGVWMDEAAPAQDVSNGLTVDIWAHALSSMRLATHANVAVLTTNYPEEDHWAAMRFYFDPQPGTQCFRIPPGERATEEYRARIIQAYATMPQLARRLVHGQFGSIFLGQQVAQGFNRDVHVSPDHLEPIKGMPLWFGQDGGHTPATVIGQRYSGRVRILASLVAEHYGVEEQLKELVLPWLGEHAPWWQESVDHVRVMYDPSMNTDDYSTVARNPLRAMRALLRGHYQPGPTTWTGRKNPMLALMNTLHLGTPVLQIDASCKALIKALNGGWYYATGPDGKITKADGTRDEAQPKKPNEPHADLGDAFCYLVAGMAPTQDAVKPMRFDRAKTHAFNVYDYHRGVRPR